MVSRFHLPADIDMGLQVSLEFALRRAADQPDVSDCRCQVRLQLAQRFAAARPVDTDRWRPLPPNLEGFTLPCSQRYCAPAPLTFPLLLLSGSHRALRVHPHIGPETSAALLRFTWSLHSVALPRCHAAEHPAVQLELAQCCAAALSHHRACAAEHPAATDLWIRVSAAP